MTTELGDLRALVFSDEDLRWICAELLTVLAHGEVPVETLNFNEIDVTVNRNDGTLTFEGVLSINDTTIELSEGRFVELAGSIAQPLSAEELRTWEQKRKRRVWPLPGPA